MTEATRNVKGFSALEPSPLLYEGPLKRAEVCARVRAGLRPSPSTPQHELTSKAHNHFHEPSRRSSSLELRASIASNSCRARWATCFWRI